MTVQHEPLYSIKSAMEYTTMSERWLRRAVFEGRVGYVKFGRLIRIPQSELDRLIEEGYRPPKKAPA